MDTVTVERLVRIYNDKHGWFYEIGPDRDGTGLIEIRYSEGEIGKFEQSMVFPAEMRVLIGRALLGDDVSDTTIPPVGSR